MAPTAAASAPVPIFPRAPQRCFGSCVYNLASDARDVLFVRSVAWSRLDVYLLRSCAWRRDGDCADLERGSPSLTAAVPGLGVDHDRCLNRRGVFPLERLGPSALHSASNVHRLGAVQRSKLGVFDIAVQHSGWHVHVVFRVEKYRLLPHLDGPVGIFGRASSRPCGKSGDPVTFANESGRDGRHGLADSFVYWRATNFSLLCVLKSHEKALDTRSVSAISSGRADARFDRPGMFLGAVRRTDASRSDR